DETFKVTDKEEFTGDIATYYEESLNKLQNNILLDVNGTQVVSYSYNSWGRMVDMSDTSNALIGIMNPFRY
ncbi:MAG: hypothetical protein II365_00410, partial [Clostridia bacterium]|nr:hypothetical protein [Clostridia bacterium]